MDNGGLLVLGYLMISFFVMGFAISIEADNPVGTGFIWPIFVILFPFIYIMYLGEQLGKKFR